MSVPSLSARSSLESLNAGSSVESLRCSSPALSDISVPDTLPPAVSGPMVWEGSELKDYVVHFTPSEIEAIEAAVLSFRLSGSPIECLDRSNFPLPPFLASKLAAVSKEAHRGCGIVVLRGLGASGVHVQNDGNDQVARFNDKEATIAFAGISAHVCPLRATDSYANQTLSHVWDATQVKAPAGAEGIGLAGSKVNVAMDFHSDRFSGDVLALHVRNDGGSGCGGEQYVASFWRIYNALLETEPEVLETMASADWPFELKQKDSAPYLELGPTLFFSKGKPMVQLVKAPLLGTPHIPREPNMPALTDKQMHALEAVESLARQFSTKLDRQQGDIQFINNLSIMHARAAYHGTNSKPSTRHLLRMFLRDPENAWEKPASWLHKFDDPFTPGRPQNIPIRDTDPHRGISGRDSHG
ncbi:Clavaminate synthase-like protein [Westerdykella ornata]|uniref:Clavaminate synthase-like protein n=1 Tax=Westerdykella ornata TaxID=318751 RepID=A0A6A6J8Q1_WESOR|nr:Clavaminate synthase-like protein [Westerdykella ornata]KAF2272940.1 Clavaminate synthase-like protein [Westerdykella ornata]